jgi:NADH-quinone oxidoreductase subunit N
MHLFAQAAEPFVGPPVNWYALTPLLILLGGGLLLLVASALLPGRWPAGSYALVTSATAAAAMVMAGFLWRDVAKHGPRPIVGDALSLDRFSLFITVTICAAVFLTALIIDDYLRREGLEGAELYGLMLMAAIGGIVMGSANDLVVLFLGLETLSIALYVMAASHLRRIQSQEAGIKYFVLGAFASAFFLYGIALVYGATGSTNMTTIAQFLNGTVLLGHSKALFVAGLALLLFGLAFKVAAAPFHFWTPDVYQGSPTPVTGFMASAAKAAGFAALLRVFVVTFGSDRVDWRPAMYVIAVLTLAVGSIFAVVQTDVKRMLAYSSINHAGFILVGVVAASSRGIQGALFYLLAYGVMVLGTFGVVTLVSRTGDGATELSSFRGLASQRPLLAFIFTVFLLAQAGVPLTSGFVAKFGVIAAAVEGKDYALAVVAMVAAVIAAFVYLRIIVSMYLADPQAGDEQRQPVRVPVSAGLALMLALAFTVVVGFLPGFLLDFARDAIPLRAGG